MLTATIDLAGVETTLSLPCDIKKKLSAIEDYSVIHYDTSIRISDYDNLIRINNALEEITTQNPNMTLEYLEALATTFDNADLLDERFQHIVISNDFYFTRVEIDEDTITKEAAAAQFLALEAEILFRDGTASLYEYDYYDYLLQSDEIDWEDIWQAYEDMGFVLYEPRNGNANYFYVINKCTGYQYD